MTFDSKQKPSFLPRLKFFKLRLKKPSPRKMVVFALFLISSLIFLNLGHALAVVKPPGDPNLYKPYANPLSLAAGLGLNAISALAAPILKLIALFCALFVDLSAQFLIFMLRPELYNNFSNQQVIKEGWEMVRNVCNLFFLLILLFIAFCTILRIEKYHAKKTLLTLIIMALLINFSKPIAIFIFDGSQLLMNYFLNANKDAVTTISNINKIAELVYKDLPTFFGTLFSSNATFTDAAGHLIFAIVFFFLYAVVLFCLALYLLIRIVAIWILIIVSPVAFLAAVIPDFNKISSGWWSAMFRYSYVGPAIAFFIWLATKLGTISFTNLASSQSGAVSMKNFIPFMAVIVFLYASLIMAQQFGIQFAGMITGWANKALRGGYFRDLGRGIRKTYRWTGVHEPMKEKLKESYPRFHSWVTAEGREKKKKELWEERVFPTAKGEQRAVATAEKNMKESNFMEDDYKNVIDKSTSSTERMAAALALAKLGKLDFTQYEKAIKDFEKNPAFKKLFNDEVKKKSIHALIDYEIDKEAKKKAAAGAGPLTQAERNTIYSQHLGSIKPVDFADQNLNALYQRAEFLDYGNATFPGMPNTVKNELAKKLAADDLSVFQGEGWI